MYATPPPPPMPQVAVAVGAVDGDANAKADAGRSSKGADNGRMGGARGGDGKGGTELRRMPGTHCRPSFHAKRVVAKL